MSEPTKAHLAYLKFIVIGQLLLEANDDLYLTNAYRHNIKNQANKLSKMLEKEVIGEYNKVYDTDPEMTTNILNKVDDLVSKIVSADLDELVMITSVIDKYTENKEWFKEYGSAEFLRID